MNVQSKNSQAVSQSMPLLDQVLANNGTGNQEASKQRDCGVMLGRIVKLTEAGEPVVEYEGSPFDRPAVASATVEISPQSVGRQAALMFIGGDASMPIVMGVLHEKSWQSESEDKTTGVGDAFEADVDGKKVLIEAQNELTLRCGKSSITLTKSGKIVIRGGYLVSRSSGANKIKGASIELN